MFSHVVWPNFARKNFASLSLRSFQNVDQPHHLGIIHVHIPDENLRAYLYLQKGRCFPIISCSLQFTINTPSTDLVLLYESTAYDIFTHPAVGGDLVQLMEQLHAGLMVATALLPQVLPQAFSHHLQQTQKLRNKHSNIQTWYCI